MGGVLREVAISITSIANLRQRMTNTKLNHYPHKIES